MSRGRRWDGATRPNPSPLARRDDPVAFAACHQIALNDTVLSMEVPEAAPEGRS